MGSQKWPQRPTEHVNADVGMIRAERFFKEEVHWIFREQPEADYGIDAHIEVVDGTDVKGRLVALQMKSGTSHLKPAAGGGWYFYPKDAHVNYWRNHSLPVVVVVYLPDRALLLCKEASPAEMQRTSSGGWRLHFARSDRLDAAALPWLRQLANGGTPYERKLRELALVLPWMERLAAGERLFLWVDQWINKSSGRGDLRVVAQRKEARTIRGHKVVTYLGRWTILAPGWIGAYADGLRTLFAGADLHMDPEEYSGVDYDPAYEYDLDEGEIGPYADDGEVAKWSLELNLNDIGRSFLTIDRYVRSWQQPQIGR